LAKPYGIKVQCHWELDGNSLGIRKKQKVPSPPQNPKGKYQALLECMWSFLVGHMKIMVLK
jgi:hypothetical protein